jgi:hypothetical protein
LPALVLLRKPLFGLAKRHIQPKRYATFFEFFVKNNKKHLTKYRECNILVLEEWNKMAKESNIQSENYLTNILETAAQTIENLDKTISEAKNTSMRLSNLINNIKQISKENK